MGFHGCFTEYKKTTLFLFILVTYFIWMDITLYYHIQSKPPSRSSASNSSKLNVIQSQNQFNMYSPFNGLTIKVMMLNHVSHYIYIPMGTMFNQVINFSERFTFITPNMISACHLMIAILAGRLMTSDNLLVRQMGVLAFEFRTFLDALDGMVARARNHQVKNISDFGSFGYFVDGIADTLGVIALLLGIFCHLKGQSLVKIAYSLLPSWKNEGSPNSPKFNGIINANTTPIQIASATTRKIVFVWGCFVVQIVLSAMLWNRYISNYYLLLESQPETDKQALLQNDVLKSALMWIIIWFWKLSNALAVIEWLLLSVFLDRIWEFLTWIQYTGIFTLITLAFFTEIHYHYVSKFIVKT